MIGDSPPNDIAAAAALGMRTCWLAPADRVPTPASRRPRGWRASISCRGVLAA